MRLPSPGERFIHDDPLEEHRCVRSFSSPGGAAARTVDPTRSSAPAENDDKVRLLREKHRQLQEAARPVLIGLQEILQASGSIIMLTDPGGTIIDLHGDSRTRDAGEHVNLAQGGRWDEA